MRGEAMSDSSSEFVQDAFEIMDQLESLRDPAPMIDRVAGWLAQFGYDSFLITGMPAPHRSATRARTITAPIPWRGIASPPSNRSPGRSSRPHR